MEKSNNFSTLDMPNIVESQIMDEIGDPTQYYKPSWAVGLEMEATYVLNPLNTRNTKDWNLKSIYALDIKKIIEYINKKYKNNYHNHHYSYSKNCQHFDVLSTKT